MANLQCSALTTNITSRWNLQCSARAALKPPGPRLGPQRDAISSSLCDILRREFRRERSRILRLNYDPGRGSGHVRRHHRGEPTTGPRARAEHGRNHTDENSSGRNTMTSGSNSSGTLLAQQCEDKKTLNKVQTQCSGYYGPVLWVTAANLFGTAAKQRQTFSTESQDGIISREKGRQSLTGGRQKA